MRSGVSAHSSINGTLTPLWRYIPAGFAGLNALTVQHVIVGSAGPLIRYSLSDGETVLEQLDFNGNRTQVTYSGREYDRRDWPSISGNESLVSADGTFSVNPFRFLGIDVWGDTMINPPYYYAPNTHHHDLNSSLPMPYIKAYDSALNQIWVANQPPHSDAQGQTDMLGASMALSTNGATLFTPALYISGSAPTYPIANGLYALNAATGAQVWFQASTPTSKISTDSSRVYGIEGTTFRTGTFNEVLTGTALVARNQSNGAIAWTQPVTFAVIVTSPQTRGTTSQAPVVMNGLVIIGTETGLQAFDAVTGTPAWTLPMTGAASPQQFGSGYSECIETRIAGAQGSNTLIVTADDGIHIVDVTTGANLSTQTLSGVVGTPRNPVIANNRLYVTDGTSFHTQDGAAIAVSVS
jgi:outer membrane protein assembly factor BamB